MRIINKNLVYLLYAILILPVGTVFMLNKLFAPLAPELTFSELREIV